MSEYRYVYRDTGQSAPGKSKTSLPKKILITVLCAFIFGAVAFLTFYLLDINIDRRNSQDITGAANIQQTDHAAVNASDDKAYLETKSTEEAASAAVTVTDVSDVVKKAMPSIVSITSTQVYEEYRQFGNFRIGSGQTYEVSGAGSGVIFSETDENYYIVTNQHVIAGASSLTVTLADGATVNAGVTGQNEDKDLAVISISKADMTQESIENVSIAQRGDSEALEVGQSVIAIGNALGYGQSVTTGIVSALDREVTTQNPDGSTTTRTLIQTDAAINPGNSGGALLDPEGKLIGINSMKYSSEEVEGMGYAIPVDEFEKELESLMTGSGIIEEQTFTDAAEITDHEMTEEELFEFFEYYFR